MINNITLMGRLVADPELKKTPSGKSVTSFTIAVERRFGKETDFIDCVAWESTAEFICKHFNKGKMIALIGELQTRSYEYEGQKRKAVEVLVGSVSFCGKETKPSVDVSVGKQAEFEEITEDDLPF